VMYEMMDCVTEVAEIAADVGVWMTTVASPSGPVAVPISVWRRLPL